MQSLDDSGISVVLCTHNGRSRLKAPICALLSQDGIDPNNFEVIVVDNASTDGTPDFVREIANSAKQTCELRIVHEPQQGLLHARRKGVAEARFGAIVFCDDDNILDLSYLSTALNLFQNTPRMGAVGGSVAPLLEGQERPSVWFYTFANAFAVGVQAVQDGDITFSRGYLWGAGLVADTRLLQLLYSDDSLFRLTGRRGEQLLSGDDAELCALIVFAGGRLHYTDQLRLFHAIPIQRQSLEYVSGLLNGFRMARPVLRQYSAMIGLIGLFASDRVQIGWQQRLAVLGRFLLFGMPVVPRFLQVRFRILRAAVRRS